MIAYGRDWEIKRDDLRDYLLDNEIATEQELSLVTSINGFNLETFESILYSRTGYRSLEQIKEMEEE
jgi:hypothetical protein